MNLASLLADAWARDRGARPAIGGLHRLSAGASAQTWRFDAELDGGTERCIAQFHAGGESFCGSLSKLDQARAQRLAREHGVCTPEVLLVLDGDGDLPAGFVTRFVEGETLGKRIVGHPAYAQARTRLPRQCAAQLARIHALDADAFDFLPIRTARVQLEELTTLHRSYGEALPVFEAALARLRESLPPDTAPCVVHGDFRTGNLLVSADGLAGVLDWELAHRGDPLEDLAWLCLRSWRFGKVSLPVGGFGARTDFYRAYETASGHTLDHAALRFWELLGTVKWGVICQSFAHRRLAGEIPGLEPAVIGRRVSEVELQVLDLLQGRGD
ncbi:MAG TPA: phosphotransferase family protein [Nevskiaceae bacterium]|nr:phosphotransferase family protein [Nevskiaceae bacterium]